MQTYTQFIGLQSELASRQSGDKLWIYTCNWSMSDLSVATSRATCCCTSHFPWLIARLRSVYLWPVPKDVPCITEKLSANRAAYPLFPIVGQLIQDNYARQNSSIWGAPFDFPLDALRKILLPEGEIWDGVIKWRALYKQLEGIVCCKGQDCPVCRPGCCSGWQPGCWAGNHRFVWFPLEECLLICLAGNYNQVQNWCWLEMINYLLSTKP